MTRCTCMAQAPWTRWIATGVARPCRLSALSPSNLLTSMKLFLSCTRSELDSPPCWWVCYGWCNRIKLFLKPFLRRRYLFQTVNKLTCKRCTTSTCWKLRVTFGCLCGLYSVMQEIFHLISVKLVLSTVTLPRAKEDWHFTLRRKNWG